MAEMGLGYGSEFQLLRFLGHHRKELNEKIKESTRLKGDLYWLDFPKNTVPLSLDGEFEGINFLKEYISKSDYDNLSVKWRNYWSMKGRQPSWDGIILHKNNSETEWVIVEAKAHINELKSVTKSSSNEQIIEAFKSAQSRFEIASNNWFGDYYQLANRLAFINFLLDNKLNASILYIYFLNGYEKYEIINNQKVFIESKSVGKQNEWEKSIEEEYAVLGINGKAKEYISSVFIDCI